MSARSLPLSAHGLAWLGALLLWAPLLAVAAFSFNTARYGVTWEGFTLEWYRALFRNRDVLSAALNTLVLALCSTAVSTVLGTLLAIALQRFPWPARLTRVLDAMVDLPVVTPDVVIAAALVIAFHLFQVATGLLEPGMTTMVIAHATFQLSFVALVVRGRLQLMGTTLSEAAFDLYATRRQLFLRVTLPLLFPGILAGALLAFTLSLDDFVISFFTSGRTNTLPIYIYSAARRGLSPEVHALSTLVVLGTAFLVLGLERAGRLVKQEGSA